MSSVNLGALIAACSPGGASCLTSVTELEPAAGPHASVAPAKFAAQSSLLGTYAYETRFVPDGEGSFMRVVIIDSKQSQLNRSEAAVALAVEEGHPILSRLPRLVVRYDRDGTPEEYSDIILPHRVFDAHIRSGSVNGAPVTSVKAYRNIRNANPANARALLDASPSTLVFGGWDSSRSSRQGRWRSALVGEIIGFCDGGEPARRGGARVDPVGMKIQLSNKDLIALADDQRTELSSKTYQKALQEAAKATDTKKISAALLGLGGIPPSLEALSGVACRRIVRSHVLSFATLRQIRFGADPDGDVACRALLAAYALNGLARSDSELYLRANCDLREKSPTVVEVDKRGGGRVSFDPLSIEEADLLLEAALKRAEQTAGVQWNGVVLTVDGNPAIVAGAVSDDLGEG
ncbi:MAG: type I-G CRISPR-associated RAMP protein Csb1/Cas7g [Actinomycetota bacterium]